MRNTSIAIAALICVGIPSTSRADTSGSNEILIIPLAGNVSGGLRSAPKRFTSTLAKLAESSGTRTVSARVAKSDITTLVGCSEESETCYAEVASTLGVDELIFGKVEQGSDGTIQVTLTRVRPTTKQKTRTRTFNVSGKTLPEVQKDFRIKAAKFLAEQDFDKPEEATPTPVTTPPVVAGEKTSFSFKRVKGYTWGITIGGAASIVLGGVLLALASSKQSDVDSAPTDSAADLNRLADLESSGRTLTTFGNSLLIVGVVAAAAGGYLIFKQGSAKTDEKRSIAVGPTARGRGVAFSLSGRF